ncbi:hypothetical protein HY949_00815 [Candidatus Gottesmanbacteria bacterium]|nr:hypothetical protein [Candidatus Gottesmanbacteria bacterium]
MIGYRIEVQKNLSFSKQPILVTEGERNIPLNILDKKQDRNYVTSVSSSSKALQIQGVISQIKSDSFNIWAQKNYSVVINDKSVVECRDKFIKLPDGSLALAYSTYLDLSKYVATLQTNRDTFLKQGKLFLYTDAYKRVEPDSWVTGVFQELEGKEKKYLLDIVLVYGCK